MADDLSGQKVWNDIARAYERFIIRTSFYQQMMQDLSSQVGDAEHVLDAGCGVGYLMNALLEKPTRHVFGVDTNMHMLDIARNEIIAPDRLARAELLQADVTQFCRPEQFDAIVSSNVLFNLRKPYDFLDNMYSSLKPGGRLVLTSAKPNPDLDRMIETGLTELRNNGSLTPELEYHANMVRDVNRRFMGTIKTGEQLFHTFDNKSIEEALLRFTGFQNTLSNADTYLNQNFLIAVSKTSTPESFTYRAAKPDEKEDMARFLYHCLYNRYNLIPSSSSQLYDQRLLSNGTSFVAIDDSTARTVGHFFMIPDVFSGECELVSKLSAAYPDTLQKIKNTYCHVGCPGKWIIHPRYQKKGVGSSLFQHLYDYSIASGMDAWIFEINPELLGFFRKIKGQDIGLVPSPVNAQSYAMFIDLKDINRDSFKR